MKMRSGFAPLIIIVVIAAVAVIGGGAVIAWRTTYFDSILPSTVREFLHRGGAVPSSESSSETPSETPEPEDPTKDWKTYTNSKYSFSFKYPKDWKTAAWISDDIVLFVFGPHAKRLELRSRPQLEVGPLGGYGSDYGYDNPGHDLTGEESVWDVEERAVSVGGRDALRFEHTYKPRKSIYLVSIHFSYFSNDNKMRLEFFPLNGEFEVFDLILSTFRFLEE